MKKEKEEEKKEEKNKNKKSKESPTVLEMKTKQNADKQTEQTWILHHKGFPSLSFSGFRVFKTRLL